MNFEPHLRLTMSGVIGEGDEIFAMNLSLKPHTGTWQSIVTGGLQLAALTAYLTDFQSTAWEDMVTDCVNYFGDPQTGVHQEAVLKRVKLAAINADGRYAGSPLESAVNTAGGSDWSTAKCPPWQVANKITLETDGDLGRIKGGFYLPLPNIEDAVYDAHTGLFTATYAGQVRDRTVTFLNDLANEPGLDDQDLRPVVASQGRHNKNGSLRAGPANPEVKRVNVGRRPDIIRRRANKRTEARLADATVAF